MDDTLKNMKYCILLLLLFSVNLFAEETYDQKLDHIYSIRIVQIEEAKERLEQLEKEYSKFSSIQQARFLNLRGHSEIIRGNYQNGLDYLEKVPLVTDNKDALARMSSMKATVWGLTGEYQKSFLETYQLLDELDTISDVQIKLSVLQNALSDHIQSEILDKSQALARKTLAYAKKYDSTYSFCLGFFSMAQIEGHFNNFEAEKLELQKARPYCQKSNSPLYVLAVDAQSVFLLKKKGQLLEAKKELEPLYETIKKFGWKLMLVEAQTELADLYLQLNELEKVEVLAKKAYDFSKKANDLSRLKESSLVLAKFYKAKNKMDEARFYNEEYKDSAIELNHQLEKKRIAYYQAMNIRKKNRKNLLNVQSEVALETP